MPIYEYLCQACSHRFEVKQSIKEDPIGSCVRCGGSVTKLISSPAIMFKGSGWYITDYSDKLKPTGEAAGTDKPAEKAADGKEAAPTPAAKESGSAEGSSTGKEATPAKSTAASPPSGSTGTAASTPSASSS